MKHLFSIFSDIQKNKNKKKTGTVKEINKKTAPPPKKKKNGWFPTPHTTTPFSKLSLLTRSRPQECSNDPDRRRCFPHFEGKSKCTNQRRKWRNFAGTKMVLQWILWLHSVFYKENTTGGSCVVFHLPQEIRHGSTFWGSCDCENPSKRSCRRLSVSVILTAVWTKSHSFKRCQFQHTFLRKRKIKSLT